MIVLEARRIRLSMRQGDSTGIESQARHGGYGGIQSVVQVIFESGNIPQPAPMNSGKCGNDQ